MPIDGRIGCAHVPERYQDRFLDSFEVVGRAGPAATTAVERFLAGDIESLLISGPIGCGKTLLAAIAANETQAGPEDALAAVQIEHDAAIETAEKEAIRQRLIRLERQTNAACPRWVTLPFLLARLRREMSSGGHTAAEELASLADGRGVLVVDDLGAERSSGWTAATLFELLGPRYESLGRTVVTSNLTPPELKLAGYGRIVSRIADGGALVHMASASDYRQRSRRSVA